MPLLPMPTAVQVLMRPMHEVLQIFYLLPHLLIFGEGCDLRDDDLFISNYFSDISANLLNQLERFSLYELQVATDKFSNRNILGRGGFGKVYKGRLRDGSLVAVKRLKDTTEGGELMFHTEVEMKFYTSQHRNFLQLRGFCLTRKERILVYPYMANGSVASCLRERPDTQPPLNWPTRKRIAISSAEGLAYLHENCIQKIIHRDIKAANILLNEDFDAVIGDFGLAKLTGHMDAHLSTHIEPDIDESMSNRDTHVTTTIRGTIGHIAPEYLATGKFTEKSDIFGYGVMLLELITGQRAFDRARLANDGDVMLLEWAKPLIKQKRLEALVDADLQNNYIDGEVEQLIQVVFLCTHHSPNERPKMSDVVRMLEGGGLAEKWKEWQKEEMFRDELGSPEHGFDYKINTDWIIADSLSILGPDELSGPR